MMKHKFKVGDVVRITEMLRRHIDKYRWPSRMSQYIGEEVKIISLWGCKHGQPAYEFKYLDHVFLLEDCLELVIEKKDYKYKKVVLENPESDNLINYKLLENKGACTEAKIAFVEAYGNAVVSKSQLIKDMNKSIKYDRIPWIKWLNDKFYDPIISDNEVYVNNYNNNRIYAFKEGMLIYLLQSNGIHHVFFASINSCNYSIQNRFPSDYTNNVLTHIINELGVEVYEFETPNDFAKWVCEVTEEGTE